MRSRCNSFAVVVEHPKVLGHSFQMAELWCPEIDCHNMETPPSHDRLTESSDGACHARTGTILSWLLPRSCSRPRKEEAGEDRGHQQGKGGKLGEEADHVICGESAQVAAAPAIPNSQEPVKLWMPQATAIIAVASIIVYAITIHPSPAAHSPSHRCAPRTPRRLRRPGAYSR